MVRGAALVAGYDGWAVGGVCPGLTPAAAVGRNESDWAGLAGAEAGAGAAAGLGLKYGLIYGFMVLKNGKKGELFV